MSSIKDTTKPILLFFVLFFYPSMQKLRLGSDAELM